MAAAAFLAAVALFGVRLVWAATIAVLTAVLGIAYPLYLGVFRLVASGRPVAVEGGRLVQRTRSGRMAATIDLATPFVARRVHYDGVRAPYSVRQGRQVIRLAVPADSNGALVREVLKLGWPPPLPSPLGYL